MEAKMITAPMTTDPMAVSVGTREEWEELRMELEKLSPEDLQIVSQAAATLVWRKEFLDGLENGRKKAV